MIFFAYLYDSEINLPTYLPTNLSGNKLINLLLYGDPQFDSDKNTRLLNAAIKCIIDSGRFTVPLV